jgi:hypothetical protein
LPAEVAVPVATFTGWNLRRREAGAEDMLASLAGSYLPFAKTVAEAKTTGDLRTSLEERYGSFANYKRRLAAQCAEMVKLRYLLEEDAERILGAADRRKGLFETEK